MRTVLVAAIASLGIVALSAGCSASSSGSAPGCNEQPFTCGAGTTCWPSDAAAHFGCVASGAGNYGDTCSATPGTATCKDGLLCLQTSSAGGGHCVNYCDTQHVCTAGLACTPAQFIGTTQLVHVCFGTGTPGSPDAGSRDAASE